MKTMMTHVILKFLHFFKRMTFDEHISASDLFVDSIIGLGDEFSFLVTVVTLAWGNHSWELRISDFNVIIEFLHGQGVGQIQIFNAVVNKDESVESWYQVIDYRSLEHFRRITVGSEMLVTSLGLIFEGFVDTKLDMGFEKAHTV